MIAIKEPPHLEHVGCSGWMQTVCVVLITRGQFILLILILKKHFVLFMKLEDFYLFLSLEVELVYVHGHGTVVLEFSSKMGCNWLS